MAHIFSCTNNRVDIIDYRSLLPAKELISMLSSPRVTTIESLGNFFSMFSKTVWFLTGTVYLFFGTLYYVDMIFEKGRYYRTITKCFGSYLEVFALFIGQGLVSMYLFRHGT